MLGPIIFIKMGNLRNKWIIWVCIGQKGTEGEQHLWNCQSWWPLVFENVQTDTSIRVDVAVIDPSRESALGRLEWIVGRETNIDEEYSSSVWGVVWAHDGRLPCELVFLIERTSWTVCGGIFSEINKFLLDSFQSHILELNYKFYFALIKVRETMKAKNTNNNIFTTHN